MEGFANRNELAFLFRGVGAEIGVYRGKYSAEIAKYADHLYCVDPYKGYLNHKQDDLDDAYIKARQRLRVYPVTFVKMSSMEALREFEDESLDFVYIDGNHELTHVTQDIYWWAKKVKKGGIVAGHDYFISTWRKSVLAVVPAVDAYAEANGIKINVTGEKGVREKSPSWWFVKG